MITEEQELETIPYKVQMRGRVENKRQEKRDEIRAKVVNSTKNPESTLTMPPSKLTYVRNKYITITRPNTVAKKYDLCCLRQKYPKLKLSQFVELEDREDEGGGTVMGGVGVNLYPVFQHGGPRGHQLSATLICYLKSN